MSEFAVFRQQEDRFLQKSISNGLTNWGGEYINKTIIIITIMMRRKNDLVVSPMRRVEKEKRQAEKCEMMLNHTLWK